ncbi:MAG: MarR family winged helix-turn-helix transcriptional regulator [Aequorivita sp.]
MENDFLVEMGYPGLTARLKRLNDAFVYQTREFYKEKNLVIEPNWHMVFLLLEKHEQMTVTEIAEALGLSHPAIVNLMTKMKNKGYVSSVRDKKDKRKSQLQLSEKAKNELPELHKYWNAGVEALKEMMNDNQELLKQLRIVEDNMDKSDYKTRILNKLNT